jgi:superfamily II DNA helicase RecQ
MELSHYCTVLDANTPRMPRIMWRDAAGEEMIFDGRPLSTSSFRSMYQQLANDTEKMMRQQVLLGLELPNLHHDVVHDELNNTEPGYSFISDTRNKFHHHRLFLISAILDDEKFGNRFFYREHSNPLGGIAWNMAGITEWCHHCETCIGNLFALAHYGAGQPARGTELAVIAPENNNLHRRNIFWYAELVNIVTMYNKTQTNAHKPRVIGRSLPPPVGQLYIIWLTLVVPTLTMVWTCWPRESLDPRRFHDRLFTSVSGNFDTDDFSSILSSVSGEPLVNFGMGCAMGMADTRHYLIAIMRKHCRGVPHRDLLEEYFNEQSGHGEDAAENYAITSTSIINVSDDRLGKFTELSKLQHRLLYPDAPASLTNNVANHQEATGSTSPLITDCEKITSSIISSFRSMSASQMAPLASQLAIALAPAMKRNIVDAFAAITPINPRDASTRPVSTCPEAESGVIVVDISKVEVQPARWRELRELMGPHATFKSPHQACALELSAQRKNDLLVVLPTGGGKSLLFMACAVNVDELNLATVVIVPLVALLGDLKSRLIAKGIRVADWANDHPKVTHYNARVIIALADTAATPEFLSYFLRGCQERKIARIVIDEIHFIITAAHYRPMFNIIKRLREGCVPVVGLSATLPPNAVGTIMQRMNFLPGNTLLIRAPTARKGIIYAVFVLESEPNSSLANASYRTPTGQLLKVTDYIHRVLRSFQPKERALIFCLSRDEAEDVANTLKCRYYHAKMDAQKKQENLDLWREGGDSEVPVLAATSAVGTGLDYGGIKLVLHYGKPRNIIDFSQESGRSGRSLPVAYSTVFWNPNRKDEKLRPGQDDIGVEAMSAYVQTDQCRRIFLQKNLDGALETATCIHDGEAVLCDVCEAEVMKVNTVSELLELLVRIGLLIAFLLSDHLKMAAAFLQSTLPLPPTPQNGSQA